MSYFQKITKHINPSLLPNRTRNRREMVLVKNLYKERAKLRKKILIVSLMLLILQLSRMEIDQTQLQKSVYGDPELDWVILNYKNHILILEKDRQGHDDLYKYMLDCFGVRSIKIYEVHHYRSMEIRDEFGRVVMQAN